MSKQYYKKTSVDGPLFVALLCLLVWLPLPLGSNRPWSMHLMELCIFLLTAIWLLSYSRHSVRISEALKNSRPLFLCMSSFLVVIVAQLVPMPLEWISIFRNINPTIESSIATISIDPHVTAVNLRKTLALICLCFLTLALVNSSIRLKQLGFALIISGVIQATYGSLMTLSGIEYTFFIPKEDHIGHATGTFVNRNHYANYLVLCLSIGTALLLADLYQSSSNSWKERGQRLIEALLGNKFKIRIGLALMVIALVLTKSRMGNTAFFIALLFSGLLWIVLTKRITRGSIILLVSLILIDVFIVGAWFGVEEVKQRLETTAFSSENRDEVNRDTWKMIQDRPLLGSGGGTYHIAFQAYRQHDIVLPYRYAHNDYLQFISEYGVIGALPLGVLLLFCFYNVIYTLRHRRTLLFQAMAFAPLMSLITMLIHSFVDFNLQIPANAATFMCILSLSWVTRYCRKKA